MDDDKYFNQRRAGPRPKQNAADTEELVCFVEDGSHSSYFANHLSRPLYPLGLNRGQKAKPKPMLGQRRAPPKKIQAPAKDLMLRNLCPLGAPKNLYLPASDKVFETEVLSTSIISFSGGALKRNLFYLVLIWAQFRSRFAGPSVHLLSKDLPLLPFSKLAIDDRSFMPRVRHT